MIGNGYLFREGNYGMLEGNIGWSFYEILLILVI
jgi:hypothetical protein